MNKINIVDKSLPIKFLTRTQINNIIQNSSAHQGLALKVKPLNNLPLEDFLAKETKTKSIVIMLDQLTDPQNIGAIIRSARAFSVSAIICIDKNTPKENSLMVKSASGSIEKIKLIYVKNFVRTINRLKESGYWIVAIDNNSSHTLKDLSKNTKLLDDNLAIIIGNENKGIRSLVQKNCDTSVKIDISKEVDSLNVSAALAIVLYEIKRK